MNEQELKTIYNGITDVWRFFRKYAGGDPYRAEFWNQALDDARTIYEKHDNHFIRKMLIAAVEEFDLCQLRKGKLITNGGNPK